MMRAEIWKAVQKLYAVGILVYFAAAGIVGVSISDFSDWASFMGRHAVYAFAWPVAAGAEIDSWRGPSGAATVAALMSLMTLGQALAAHVRLIVWCKSCNHRAEPDVATHVAHPGFGTPVPD